MYEESYDDLPEDQKLNDPPLEWLTNKVQCALLLSEGLEIKNKIDCDPKTGNPLEDISAIMDERFGVRPHWSMTDNKLQWEITDRELMEGKLKEINDAS